MSSIWNISIVIGKKFLSSSARNQSYKSVPVRFAFRRRNMTFEESQGNCYSATFRGNESYHFDNGGELVFIN